MTPFPTTATLACHVCAHAPANPNTLLWDVDTDQRYCADQNACRHRAAGRQPETPRDHGRCEAWGMTHGNTVERCARDLLHQSPHRDAQGREWEVAA